MTEMNDAEGNASGPLLPEAQGQQGQVERSGNLPEVNESIPSFGEGAAPSVEEQKYLRVKKHPGGWESTRVPYRTCKKCGVRKRLSEYLPNPTNSRGGFKSICKACDPEQAKRNSVTRVFQFKADKNLDRRINKSFKALVDKRMELFRCDALDALHDIAMMPLDEIISNAQLVLVKKEAAQLLATGVDTRTGQATNTFGDLLKELNAKYHAAAPRIKSMRERVVEFEGGEELPPLLPG